MHIASLHVHPVKSCAGIELREARVSRLGLEHDRRWMVVDPDGPFLTGRQHPRLVLIRPRIEAQGLLLAAPGMPELALAQPLGGGPRRPVQVWKDTVFAACAGAHAAEWFSAFLQRSVHLVYMDEQAQRAPAGAAGIGALSFADAAPVLAVSRAALDGLNARLTSPVSMQRFRPNLVIAGCAAHAEDAWQRVRFGGIDFEAGKRCGRCTFITVDPESGERDALGQPLAELARYRRYERNVCFGRYWLPLGEGLLRVGDAVTPLA